MTRRRAAEPLDSNICFKGEKQVAPLFGDRFDVVFSGLAGIESRAALAVMQIDPSAPSINAMSANKKAMAMHAPGYNAKRFDLTRMQFDSVEKEDHFAAPVSRFGVLESERPMNTTWRFVGSDLRVRNR